MRAAFSGEARLWNALQCVRVLLERKRGLLSAYVRADAAEASVLLLTRERRGLVMSSGEVAVLFDG